MAEILSFPNKKEAPKKSQEELIEAFSARLVGVISSICFAKHYDDVPVSAICRAMTQHMISDDFEYSENVLNAMLDDPEIRIRTLSIFIKMLKDHGHIT